MEKMIKAYEAERKRLGSRLAELRKILKTGKLKTMERESIEQRISLITVERTELLHSIHDMQLHLGGVS